MGLIVLNNGPVSRITGLLVQSQVLAGTVHECSLTSRIGRVSLYGQAIQALVCLAVSSLFAYSINRVKGLECVKC